MIVHEFYSRVIEQWVVCSSCDVESLMERGYETRSRTFNQDPMGWLKQL